MRFVINDAGNRIVDATPEETHALLPALRAAFRRWRANEADIEDLCQQVESVMWQALSEGRVHEPDASRPEDASGSGCMALLGTFGATMPDVVGYGAKCLRARCRSLHRRRPWHGWKLGTR